MIENFRTYRCDVINSVIIIVIWKTPRVVGWGARTRRSSEILVSAKSEKYLVNPLGSIEFLRGIQPEEDVYRIAPRAQRAQNLYESFAEVDRDYFH